MTGTALTPRTRTGDVQRAEIINGLRMFALFAQNHPDLPLASGGDPLRVSVFEGTDAENRAEIERIAAILGVNPAYPFGTTAHYRAVRAFGGVIYEATAITRASMDEYHAVNSYQGCVKPEDIQAEAGAAA